MRFHFFLSFIYSFASLAAPYPHNVRLFTLLLSFLFIDYFLLFFASTLFCSSSSSSSFFFLFFSFWHNTYSSLPCLLSDLKCNYRLAFPNISYYCWQSHLQLYNIFGPPTSFRGDIILLPELSLNIQHIWTERNGSKWATEQNKNCFSLFVWNVAFAFKLIFYAWRSNHSH